MPAVVGYIADYLWLYVVEDYASALVIAEIVVDVAISFALGKISQALAGNSTNQTGPSAQTETVQGTLEPRRVVYGQVMTSGVILFFGTHGRDSTCEWEVI